MIPVDVERGDRFVLVTHRHPDHFDPLAVRKIVGDAGILAYDSDMAPLASGPGFKVRPATLYEPHLLGDFTATSVPALDGYGDPQFSWIVSAGGRRILHCGDIRSGTAIGGGLDVSSGHWTLHSYPLTELDLNGVNRGATFLW